MFAEKRILLKIVVLVQADSAGLNSPPHDLRVFLVETGD